MSNIKVKFKLNRAGVKEILRSGEAQGACGEYAQQMFGSVSGVAGYYMEPRKYQERAGYAILAKEYPAIGDNLNNNTLLKISGA